jgi:glycosyltransferase involved in cell wall biosynthesis
MEAAQSVRRPAAGINMEGPSRKRISILAPFLSDPHDVWIDSFCNRPDFEFTKEFFPASDRRSWHERHGTRTPIAQWLSLLKYARASLKGTPDCIITCMPQLALAAAALSSFGDNSTVPLIAWHFNIGSISNQWKGYFAGRILRRVDRFVVHARSEIKDYAEWLGLDEGNFRFVPLQRADFDNVKPSPIEKPYIVSMGSANRDYKTLVDAARGTGIKTVIIAKKAISDSLPDHPDLLKLTNLTAEECRNILGGAEMNIVPISSTSTAAGQVTFITSMSMGIPSIVTRCVGSVDYIHDWKTGVLVEPGDIAALRQAIQTLWRDQAMRLRIGEEGCNYARENLSDEAAGRSLAEMIDDVFAS